MKTYNHVGSPPLWISNLRYCCASTCVRSLCRSYPLFLTSDGHLSAADDEISPQPCLSFLITTPPRRPVLRHQAFCPHITFSPQHPPGYAEHWFSSRFWVLAFGEPGHVTSRPCLRPRQHSKTPNRNRNRHRNRMTTSLDISKRNLSHPHYYTLQT